MALSTHRAGVAARSTRRVAFIVGGTLLAVVACLVGPADPQAHAAGVPRPGGAPAHPHQSAVTYRPRFTELHRLPAVPPPAGAVHRYGLASRRSVRSPHGGAVATGAAQSATGAATAGAACDQLACAVTGNLRFGGGAVTEGSPVVYLLFAGSMWGTASTTADGYTTFSNDPSNEAVQLEKMFVGLGTDGEAWSATPQSYCDNVPTGSTSCTVAGTARMIGRPPATGMTLQMSYLNTSSGNDMNSAQLALAASAYASQVGISSANKNAQIFIASAHGSKPDGFPATSWCAWHATSNGIPYTNMPYVTDATGCNDGVTRGITQTSSHEYAEVLTDPDGTSGWRAAAGSITYGDGTTNSSSDTENADLCQNHPAASVTLATGTFALATTWSNQFQQCVGLPAKVLVVGDSITNGMIGDYTWRYRLLNNFQASHTPIVFVGARTGTYDMYIDPATAAANAGQPAPDRNLLNPDPTDGSYRVPFPNSAHESVWGWTMSSAASSTSPIGSDAANAVPDYLVVALGFNDMAYMNTPASEQQAAQATQQNLSAIVANVRQYAPNVKVVVTSVIQRAPLAGYPNVNAASSMYNSSLPSYLSSISSAASPVTEADVASAYNPSADAWDGLHPNSIGEYVIAGAVAGGLQNVGLGTGSVLATPTTVDAISLVAPTVTATTTPSGVQLTWSHVYGASGYYITKTTTSTNATVRLPLPIAWGGWLDRDVLNKNMYSYQVSAARGPTVSALSTSAAITASVSTLAGPVATVTPSSSGTTFSWAPVSGASSYAVTWFDTATSTQSTGTTTSTSYVVPIASMTAGHTYAVSVSTVNSYGTGAVTGAPPFVAGYGTPAVPSIQVSYLNSSTDTVTWTESTPAAGFWVFQRIGTSGAWLQLPIELAGNLRLWNGGVSGSQHGSLQFCLAAANGSLRSACSSPVTAP